MCVKPQVVYIPPGTYEVTKTIYMNTDTILMGDATNVSFFTDDYMLLDMPG